MQGAIVHKIGSCLPVRVLKPKMKQNGFKDCKKVTKRGSLVVFEHFDQNPLFLLQLGMASRLRRHIGQHQELWVGPLGEIQKRKSDVKRPLLG